MFFATSEVRDFGFMVSEKKACVKSAFNFVNCNLVYSTSYAWILNL